MTFYSQFGEDEILASIFLDKPLGLCVEVGANDGRTGSTTLFFEQRGWNCVLVEPNPELCIQLRAERKAFVAECAASNEEGEAVLNVGEGGDLAHGVSTIESSDAALATLHGYGFRSRPLTVPTQRLDTVLEESGFDGPIDFVSIDVEGHELNVLKGFSIERWQPRIVIIEDNAVFQDREVRDYMVQRGYHPFRRTGVNDWFARNNDLQLVSRSAVSRYDTIRRKALVKARLRSLPGVLEFWRFAKRTVGK